MRTAVFKKCKNNIAQVNILFIFSSWWKQHHVNTFQLQSWSPLRMIQSTRNLRPNFRKESCMWFLHKKKQMIQMGIEICCTFGWWKRESDQSSVEYGSWWERHEVCWIIKGGKLRGWMEVWEQVRGAGRNWETRNQLQNKFLTTYCVV